MAGFSAGALGVRVLLAARGGLWRDEALFLSVTQLPSYVAMLDFLRWHESHPPLFYLGMRGWLRLAGDSDVAALVPPLLFGVAMVPAIYSVGSRLFSKRVGLVAAALVTVSPSLAEQSAAVRPYSLLPLLALISAYTLIIGIERGARKIWLAHSLITLLMVYTHNWAWLVVGGECVALAAVMLGPVPRGRTKVAREWAASQVLVTAGYLVWAPTFVYQVQHAGQPPGALNLAANPVASVGFSARRLLESTILGYMPVDRASAGMSAGTWFVMLPIVFLLAAQYLRARARPTNGGARSRDEANLSRPRGVRTALTVLVTVPLAAWCAALALSPYSDLMIRRCLSMLAPALLLLLAYWLARAGDNAARKMSCAALVVLLTTYAVTLQDLARTPKSNARELARLVTRRTQPTDLVIIVPDWLSSAFNRYYQPETEQIDYPGFGKQRVVDFADVRTRTIDPIAADRVRVRIAEARSARRRVWFIVNGNDLDHLRTEDVFQLLHSSNYAIAALGRVADLRRQLDSLYGSPDTTVVVRSRTAQHENLRALLYVPAAGLDVH